MVGKTHLFYEFSPDLEVAAKLYALEKCSGKSASLAVVELARFIDDKLYETTNITKGRLLIITFSKHESNLNIISFTESCESTNTFNNYLSI